MRSLSDAPADVEAFPGRVYGKTIPFDAVLFEHRAETHCQFVRIGKQFYWFALGGGLAAGFALAAQAQVTHVALDQSMIGFQTSR